MFMGSKIILSAHCDKDFDICFRNIILIEISKVRIKTKSIKKLIY